MQPSRARTTSSGQVYASERTIDASGGPPERHNKGGKLLDHGGECGAAPLEIDGRFHCPEDGPRQERILEPPITVIGEERFAVQRGGGRAHAAAPPVAVTEFPVSRRTDGEAGDPIATPALRKRSTTARRMNSDFVQNSSAAAVDNATEISGGALNC
jgi:hypothetical protein